MLGLLSLDGLPRPGMPKSQLVSITMAAVAGLALVAQGLLDQRKEQVVQVYSCTVAIRGSFHMIILGAVLFYVARFFYATAQIPHLAETSSCPQVLVICSYQYFSVHCFQFQLTVRGLQVILRSPGWVIC